MENNKYDKLAEELVATGDYKVIKRFVPVEAYHETSPEDVKIGIFLSGYC